MKELPILFSGAMVRAILAGQKRQTRRVMNPQPEFDRHGMCWYPRHPRDQSGPGREMHYGSEIHFVRGVARDFCPYGQPGDRLWVRETWGKLDMGSACYRADDEGAVPADGRWRPSIHMPRWASRITLEAVEVRVQRLQEISEGDARAEGAPVANGHPERGAKIGAGPTHREGFAQLWTDINGERPGCSWEANPFVWAITFRMVKP